MQTKINSRLALALRKRYFKQPLIFQGLVFYSLFLQVAKADPNVPELLFLAEDKLCHCYLKLDQQQDALPYCTAALRHHEEPRILCDRAEVHIALDMLDEAQQDYSKVIKYSIYN